MKLAGNFIAGLATAAALVAAPAAQAACPGANGRIAFERSVGATYRSSTQIFGVCPGGKGEALLAAPRGDLPTAPSFSADGRRLVFERQSRLGYGTIQIARADGTGERAVPGEGHHPSLAPDGSRLALDSGGAVWTESLDGSHRTRLTTGTDPEWSPDGRRIAFVREGDLYVIRIAGGAERRLTRDGANAGPSWSPAGNALAFWHTSPGAITIETIGAGGAHRRKLAGGMQPAWSPDGALIAYAGAGGVWSMRPDGSRKRLMVHNGFMPAWQPVSLPR